MTDVPERFWDDIEVQRRLRRFPNAWEDLEAPLSIIELLSEREIDAITRVIPEPFITTCHHYNMTPFQGVLAIIRRRREIEEREEVD